MKKLRLATALSMLFFAAAETTAQTRAPQRPRAAGRARAEGPRTAQPQPAPATARVETTQNFETLIAADSYAVYATLRSAGQFLRSGEFTQMLDSLRFLTSPKEAQELEEVIFFFVTQAEALNNTNVTLGMLPARDGVPDGLVAFQFPNIEAAAAFEPKFRAFLTRQLTASESPPRRPAGTRRRAESAQQPAGRQRRQGAKRQPARFDLKRTGNVLIVAGQSFTLKKLRGDGDNLLASDARFQSFRGRFANDPLFVYVEVGRLERGFAREREQREKQWEAERAAGVTTTTATTTTATGELTSPLEQPPELPPAADPTQIATTLAESVAPDPVPEPTAPPETADAPVVVPPAETGEVAATAAEGPRVETAPQVTQTDVLIPMLFGGMMRGNPRWPEAFGVALSFDKDDYVLRALLANPAGETVHVIPFLPTFAAGPATALEASSVAPAETEIFASASVDWQQMYEALMEGMQRQHVAPPGEEAGDAAAEQRFTAEDAVKLFEKAAGFKIREDLLPALGNEVSVSAPVAWFSGSTAGRQTRSAEAQEARAGAVLLLSLNNPEGMRKMLPRLLEAVGMKSPLDPGKTEKRADIEINLYGGISAAFMHNYLALSNDPAALRHFVDGAQQTLLSNQSFRNATGWQPRQKLGSVYVSPALMESLLADARKWLDPEDVELQNLFARLNIQPSPATYAVTSEGGGELLHELRLPKGILKILSAQTAVAAKNAALIQNEQSAMYHLRMVYSWQETFKTAEGKGKYGNLDDLLGAGARERSWTPFSKSDLEQLAYKIEIASSGEKFQATATPKQYGKSARRSFFIDESGVLRGADHRGEPATANDPPVD